MHQQQIAAVTAEQIAHELARPFASESERDAVMRERELQAEAAREEALADPLSRQHRLRDFLAVRLERLIDERNAAAAKRRRPTADRAALVPPDYDALSLPQLQAWFEKFGIARDQMPTLPAPLSIDVEDRDPDHDADPTTIEQWQKLLEKIEGLQRGGGSGDASAKRTLSALCGQNCEHCQMPCAKKSGHVETVHVCADCRIFALAQHGLGQRGRPLKGGQDPLVVVAGRVRPQTRVALLSDPSGNGPGDYLELLGIYMLEGHTFADIRRVLAEAFDA